MGASGPFYLGIDLGGTNIKIGIVDDSGHSVAKTSIPTLAAEGWRSGVKRMGQAARELAAKSGMKLSDLEAAGIGSPGPMDLKRQILLNPHNLPGWHDTAIAEKVSEECELPAVLQNDANAAAYGEYWVGAGKGRHSLVQFTLGTGIGCGIVIAGAILEGEHSHGAEAGHQRISLDSSRRNGTGLFGSLEAYASAPAVVARLVEAVSAGHPSSLASRLAEREELTSKEVFDAADAGDELAKRIVDETAFYLAIGAVNLMHIIDPDVVVYSGGMIAAGDSFLDMIRAYVRDNALPVPAEKTKVLYALLGTDAGFIGAAGCARRKFGISR